MHFQAAKRKFRELEVEFLNGELAEDDFLARVAGLQVTDEDGRRWMIHGRTGRWMVHDGQQWIFAQPPHEGRSHSEPAFEAPTPLPRQPGPEAAAAEAAPTPAARPVIHRDRALASSPSFTRRMALGFMVAVLALGCLVAGGVTTWVMFLRDLGEATPEAAEPSPVAMVETYTPRPATATYTSTPTATPSRTSRPTATSTPTNTPPPSSTPLPPSPTPTVTRILASPTTGPTAATVVTGRTYTVQPGETLSEIAARFDISLSALAEANGITNPALIQAGQVLTIPSSATATATATATPTVSTTPTRLASVTPTGTPTRTPSPTPTQSKLTATPRPTSTPTVRPAALSGKIAFTVWNTSAGAYELYVSRIDGGGRNLLGLGFRQPQFRQDGNVLAVNGDGKPDFEHMVKMNAAGGEVAEISNYTEDAFPTWSPDGNIVAYSSLSYGDGQSRLGIVHDMFGKQQDWIPINATEIRGEYPFWMADGRIVYHGCAFLTDHASCGLFWVGAGGGNYVQLTNNSSDTGPAGSGSRVAFMSARDGNWEIYIINMDGSGLKRLTNNGAQDGLPTWSPDGKSIAFVSNRDGGWAIWVMDASGSNQRKLFSLSGGYGSGEYDWTRERISWAP